MKPARTTRWQHLLSALRNDNGSAAGEFALVLPIFLLMVFGSIYSCMLMGAIVELHQVTENAARCLSVDSALSCTSANINTYASGQYAGPAISSLTFTPTQVTSCGSGVAGTGGNQVVGTGNFTLFTGAGNFTVHLSSTACYPVI